MHIQHAWGLIVLSLYVSGTSSSQQPLRKVENNPGIQDHTQDYTFDPLLHLPGISPYFDAIGAGLNHDAPRGCEVVAASYLLRHAAIYANKKDWKHYIRPFLKKLQQTQSESSDRVGWAGPLAFFADWQNPIDDPDNQLEEITPHGVEDSKAVGKHLLRRYPKLVPTVKKIYADMKTRTQDTAAAFIQVFPQDVEIVKLNNTHRNFHAQVPHKACKNFNKKPGDGELKAFIDRYTPHIAARLQRYSPVHLENNDIMGLQQLCGYESAITGNQSAICNVFSDDEWMAYEYAWDLKYASMVGFKNPLSPYLGFPWLNVTSHLLSGFHAEQESLQAKHPSNDDNPPAGQRLFLSFTHREVPPFLATALNLFGSPNAYEEEFPTDRINWSRSWRMSELIPFLGHVGIEKVSCAAYGRDVHEPGEFIRVIANSAPRPMPDCQSGPGASCPMADFEALVREGMERYGDFEGVCGSKRW